MSPGGNKRLGLFGQIIWLINIVIAITLLLSYLSSYVDPAVTPIFALLGLAYLPLLLMNFLFCLYWLIRRNRRLWLSLLVMLLGFNIITAHIQALPGREAPEEGVISILSYNVQNMAFTNTGRSNVEIRNEIISYLSKQDVDIVCIQEYSSRGVPTSEAFSDILSLEYPYVFTDDNYPPGEKNIEGKLILSKFPAIDTAFLSYPRRKFNFGFCVDLLVHEDTVRVYNLHLESIGFQSSDYQFVEEFAKGHAEQAALRRGSSSIVRKLLRAFNLRSQQTEVVIQSLSECPYPVIICGDFNDTPLSFAYRNISKGLDDAFIQAGYGLGNTFNGKLPPMRIDYIFHSPGFEAYDFNVHRIDLSDHFPVSTYLSKVSSE